MIAATISSSFVLILPKICSRCGTRRKTISSSRCIGVSAELVSGPNNILFSSHTYRFLMFHLLMLHSVRRRHIGVPFKVVEMEVKYLKQPVRNNEYGFYVMWAMLRYISGKSEEADKLVCIIPISFMSVNHSTK